MWELTFAPSLLDLDLVGFVRCVKVLFIVKGGGGS